jgi:hypothetical protein
LNLKKWKTPPPPPPPPSYVDEVPAGGPELATLAVLAHEMGHVLYYDGNVDGRTETCRPIRVDTCFDTVFVGQYWDKGSWQKKRYVTFRARNSKHKKSGIPEVDVIDSLIPAAPDQAAAAIRQVYTGDFVSLFSAVSPEEDFVETYKYLILNNRLQQLNIVFPVTGAKLNTLDALKFGAFNKADCLNRLHLSP